MLGVTGLSNVTVEAWQFGAAGCTGGGRIIHHLLGRLRRVRSPAGPSRGASRAGAEDGGFAAHGCKAWQTWYMPRPTPTQGRRLRAVSVSDIMKAGNGRPDQRESESRPRRVPASTRHSRIGAYSSRSRSTPTRHHSGHARDRSHRAAGRIINPKASHSQEIGGRGWGIGMALHRSPSSIIGTADS